MRLLLTKLLGRAGWLNREAGRGNGLNIFLAVIPVILYILSIVFEGGTFVSNMRLEAGHEAVRDHSLEFKDTADSEAFISRALVYSPAFAAPPAAQ